jgi:hypothetical protein
MRPPANRLRSVARIASRPTRLALLTLLLAGLQNAVLGRNSCSACDTPVYRYAMYSDRWAPWPYTVYYFHAGSEASEDAAANARLRELASAEPKLTNLDFVSVDTTSLETLDALPLPIRQQWERLGHSHPMHLVANPMHRVFSVDRLSRSTVEALAHSPLRAQIAESLGQGQIVFLLLEGTEPQANRAAREVIEQARKLAAEGKITFPLAAAAAGSPEALLPPPSATHPAEGPQAGRAASTRPQIDLLAVSAIDAFETFLPRMLLSLSHQPAGSTGVPRLYLVFGRGRAIGPLVGEEITVENLLHGQGVAYLCGPCSCEVKEQNPGVDLLMTADWNQIAQEMAQRLGDAIDNAGSQSVTSLVPTLAAPRAAAERVAAATPSPEQPVAIWDGDHAALPVVAGPAAHVPPPGLSRKLGWAFSLGGIAVVALLTVVSWIMLRSPRRV